MPVENSWCLTEGCRGIVTLVAWEVHRRIKPPLIVRNSSAPVNAAASAIVADSGLAPHDAH